MSAEILAPAGGMDSLKAAIYCGADAVYLGLGDFNARRGAQNFTPEQLREAVRFCHIYGAKLYVTLNTLVKDGEFAQLIETAEQACAAGVDAVLVQDLAVWALMASCAPDMSLHASTQMTVHECTWTHTLARLGFSRAVLARECTRDEIVRVTKAARDSGMETEVFVHGAHCMSVSGQCYLSAMIGGRSGNRGMCAQPCRLPFAAGTQKCALSLKDMSLTSHLRELAQMGVASLKIEGRMKRPEYVAAAVTACRQALAGERPDEKLLRDVFSRDGFTDGYYRQKMDRDMFGARSQKDVQAAAGVLKELGALYENPRNHIRRAAVDVTLRLHAGDPAMLVAVDSDGRRVHISGDAPQPAQKPTTEDRARAAIAKTGGTPYYLRNFQFDCGPDLMLPASALNAMRREALEALDELRGAHNAVAFDLQRAHAIFPYGHLPEEAVRLLKSAGASETAGISFNAGGSGDSGNNAFGEGHTPYLRTTGKPDAEGRATGPTGARANGTVRAAENAAVYAVREHGISRASGDACASVEGKSSAGQVNGVPSRVEREDGAGRGLPDFRARLLRTDQLSPDLLRNAALITLPCDALLTLLESNGQLPAEKFCAGLPRVDFSDGRQQTAQLEKLREMGVRHVCIATGAFLDRCIQMGFLVHGDATLNVFNLPSALVYREMGLCDITLSWELDLESARRIARQVPAGVSVYGHLPMMVMRNCPVRANVGCDQCAAGKNTLTDRTGRQFFTNCAYGAPQLYNPAPLYLGDRMEAFSEFSYVEFRFTKEDAQACNRMIAAYENGESYHQAGEFTRGLFYRKVT